MVLHRNRNLIITDYLPVSYFAAHGLSLNCRKQFDFFDCDM